MILEIKKRDRKYRVDGYFQGRRIRASLGTANAGNADAWKEKIKRALESGADCPLWPELQRLLPPQTFRALSQAVGYEEKKAATVHHWKDLVGAVKARDQQRIQLGKLAASTKIRYDQTLASFTTFLGEANLIELRQITRPVVENYKVWRLAKIREKKFSRGGTGVSLDAAILHRTFQFAVEIEMVEKNPVRLEGRPGDSPDRGAQPFNGEHLGKMRQNAGADLLSFLLLRWTGLRGSDAVSLTWAEIDWDGREINRLTVKRKKRVILPIPQELYFALETERDRRRPKEQEHVLVNPTSGRPMTRPRLYQRMLALGKRAGVADSHPHRFRDTLAVDMLARGASPYDVAKLLGDTVATVEKHYAPFVKELRERARRLMENGEGLEKVTGTFWAQSEVGPKRMH